VIDSVPLDEFFRAQPGVHPCMRFRTGKARGN
jgi:hypothetical protein